MMLDSPMKVDTKMLEGRWYTFLGVSICCMTPPFMTAMRSDTARASSWSWVTYMVVMPTCCWMRLMAFLISTLSFASRLDRGSSMSSTSGG